MSRMPMPALGFGTYKLNEGNCVQAVRLALEVGYRHIDTASMYRNEAEVGEGIRASGVPRDHIFLTTKVWHDRMRRGDVVASLKDSLQALNLDHVDLALVHWPSVKDEVPMAETLQGMMDAQKQGLTRLIGVSNFTIRHLDLALDCVPPGTITTNQIEVHPYLQNRRVIEYAHRRGVHLTAYMPLARGKVFGEPAVRSVAARHQCTPAQAVIAWILRQHIAAIPSSSREENIRENFAARQVRLDDSDMASIATLDRGERLANPDFAPDWD